MQGEIFKTYFLQLINFHTGLREHWIDRRSICKASSLLIGSTELDLNAFEWNCLRNITAFCVVLCAMSLYSVMLTCPEIT